MVNYDVRECDQCGGESKYDFADERHDEFHHIGWLSLAWIVGPEEMKEYDFCSFECLLEWVKEQG